MRNVLTEQLHTFHSENAMKTKVCTACGKRKVVNRSFHRTTVRGQVRERPDCKACVRAKQKARQARPAPETALPSTQEATLP